MFAVRVYAEDTSKEMAEKIFQHFILNQSCSVTGFEIVDDEPVHKGELVLNHLRAMDEAENTRTYGKKLKRNRRILENSIGGPVAQKIFRYETRTVNKTTKTTIWRIQ